MATSNQQIVASDNTRSSNVHSARDWGRSGEPGSAFSGLRGRGRGRNHARVARGGRGGRAKTAETTSIAPTPTNPEVSMPPSTTPTSAPADNSRSNPAPVESTPASKAKPTPKRPPRSVPTLVVDSSSPTSNVPPSTTTTPRTPNRRNRSQQQKSPNPASDKLAVPDSKPPRTRKSRSSIPPSLVLPKDVPPHLGVTASAGPATSTFDIRNDIDAFVERVRAVAMADNRPTTPGSHIDWAGDEDDTLPDLDDWGVTTGTSTGTNMGDMASPISVGGLRSLPDSTEQPSTTSEATEPPVPCNDVPTINVVEIVSVADPNNANSSDALAEAPCHSSDSLTGSPFTQITQPIVVHPDIASQTNLEPLSAQPLESPTPIAEYPRKPLHPSLPPKPVAAMESLLAQSRLRPGAIAVRLPNSKSPNATEGSTADTVNLPPQPSPEDETRAASIPNPAHTNQEPAAEQTLQGLGASIHAPHQYAESSFLASTSSVGLPTAPRGFNSTHHRSHTAGRPQTAPMTSFPTTSHSGYSTPHGRYSPSRNYHMRTHSSPADSPTSQRTSHSTRPVITGDALSKLARTICNSGVSPTRTVAVSPSKD